ncbi:hypothetical protein NQ176_g4147 [Zarea fungicola]|uniref:Uncharacterized protein n=1 Tax=Zarea fungicola TaxID=93591 RepID=A0ACC1NET8_9HYPO|nr:hypothetical protein NQ176_g4147 [Lecanicillium fungicola]
MVKLHTRQLTHRPHSCVAELPEPYRAYAVHLQQLYAASSALPYFGMYTAEYIETNADTAAVAPMAKEVNYAAQHLVKNPVHAFSIAMQFFS